ncbi:MAG TPA: carbohydrate-binding domain-containing protein [Crenalkalicoccus sp.]|nr:carbohydrate-binding domain-containing protein [Crenalkalicoccus sp.]
MLQIAEDAYLGDARYRVTVDGTRVGKTFTASALHASGQADTLTIQGDWAPGTHTVAVKFLNDAWGGTPDTDRNLYVEGITYNGVAVPGGSAALYSAGAKAFDFTDTAAPAPGGGGGTSGPDKLTVYLSGDAWNGNPQATLTVNGAPVGGVLDVAASHAHDDVSAFTVEGNFGPAPKVGLSFINDASSGTPGQDRNLYLGGFTYDGVEQRGLKSTLGWDQTQEFTLSATSAPAMRAADFVGKLGVCVHLDYFNTAYGLPDGSSTDMAKVTKALGYLGVHNLRVGVPTPETLPQLQALAAAGYKFDVLMPSSSSDGQLKGQLDAIRPILGAVTSIEGPNEVNLTSDFSWNGQQGDAAARGYQQALYTAVKSNPDFAGIKVDALTLAGVGTDYYAAFGDMSHSADAGNMHVYSYNSAAPAPTIRYALGLAGQVTPGLPTVFTETNYTSAPAIQGSTTEAVQGKYVLELIMDTAQAGVAQTYLYELLDVRNDPGQTGSDMHYGLFHADGTPKSAATGLHNLTAILADTGPNASGFQPDSFAYSLSGLPASGNSMVLQKSSGEHDLLVWAEPELWDATHQIEVPATARPVTLNLGTQHAHVDVFDPLVGTTPIASYHYASSVQLTLLDHPLVVQVSDIA